MLKETTRKKHRGQKLRNSKKNEKVKMRRNNKNKEKRHKEEKKKRAGYEVSGVECF